MANSDLTRSDNEHKRGEEAAREEEDLYRLVAESAKDFIRLHELDGRSIYASPSVVQFLGMQPADMFDRIHPDDLEKGREWWQKILAGGQERMEWRAHDAVDRWRWCETSAALVRYHGKAHVLTVCRDITERKKALETLRQSEERLHMVLTTLPVGVSVVDRAGDIVLVNPASKRIWGETIVSGRERWAESKGYWHDSGMRIAATEWASIHALTDGQTTLNELIDIETYDGQRKTIRNSAAPIRNADQSIAGAVIVNEDVTERVRADAALRESERKLKEAQLHAHIGYWEHDLVTERITASPETDFLFGLPVGASLSMAQFDAMIHPDDRELHRRALADALRGDAVYDVEYRVIRPDGDVRYMHVRDKLVRDESGRPVRMYGMVQDVTERKRIEEQLRRAEEDSRRSEHELHLVIDTIPVMAWTVRPDGVVDFLNRRWLSYSGLSLEQYVADPTGPIHSDDVARVMGKWRVQIALGEGYDDEMRLRRSDGEYRWFLVRTSPLRDEQGAVVKWYGVSTDIEERKRAEEALRDSTERLRHLSHRLLEVQEEERRHLARELHDEFGQFLATITLHLHAARGAAGEAARPQLEECLALLQRAGEQVRSLALELRPTMLETTGLETALRRLADQHQQRTGIATHVVGHLNDVSGDLAIACFRVAQEALTNVVRHAQAQHVWIELRQSESELELDVRDDGVGFDARETLERAPARGSLGLLGMRERVEFFGGNLEVESAPTRGTRIHAFFPLARRTSEPAEDRE